LLFAGVLFGVGGRNMLYWNIVKAYLVRMSKDDIIHLIIGHPATPNYI
jgi:hypothetical protein